METGYKFQSNPVLYYPSNAFVAHLSGISSKDQLLSKLKIRLHLPEYFGFNWDALYDLLRDLHWIKEEKVVLVHDLLPALDGESLKTYLILLTDAVNDWKSNNQNRLEVVFPQECRDEIETVLRLLK